jgi:hypothetical protein
MAEIQELVDAAVAAALLAAGGAPPAGDAAPAGGILQYARNPAQVSTGLLNYGSSEGMKIYNSAVTGLAIKYTGKALNMHLFLKGVKARGDTFGWKNILNVPTEGGGSKNLTDQYGLISLAEVKAHAMVYEETRGRDAQNSSQMYEFLLASLTAEAMSMVLSDFEDYMIVLPDGTQVGNGPCLLKVIIRNTTVDTKSTIFHIRDNLNHLQSKMLEVSYDIEEFNLYVTSQVEELAARGAQSSDLLINLFEAYLAVPDRKFVDHIEKQKDKFEDGDEVTEKTLMQVALIKFKDRKRSDKWQAPSAEESEIVALKAEIGELKKAKTTTPSAGKAKKSGSTTKSEGKQKQTRAERFAVKYAWKLVPPVTGEPTTKVVENKTYHFCPHHNENKGAWVIHLPSKCDRRDNKKKDKPAAEKLMSLTKALQAIHEEGGDEISDEDE